MNKRSLFSIAAMSAMYAYTAAATTAPKKLTAHTDDNIGTGLAKLRIDDDNVGDAGGTDTDTKVKTVNDVMGEGVDKIAEVRAAEQQQAAASSDTGQVDGEEVKKDDAGTLSGTTPVGDPASGGQTQQA